MALSLDRSRCASAPLCRKASRRTSASWTICNEQPTVSFPDPRPQPDENAKRREDYSSILEHDKRAFPTRGNNQQSSISEVLAEATDVERRRRLRTSQDTTIVRRQRRSKSGSHLVAYLETPQPQPSFLQFSILSGETRSHTPRVELEVRSKKATDNLKRDAETDYYEHIDYTGTTRRRSMIRNVSRDDYLLARGANPRTGIVTPGSHSASSSFDEAQVLRARGIALPPKWRQRGNEWISLEFDQPTPVPTPPTTKGSHQSQGLRTPQRITSGEHQPQRRESLTSGGEVMSTSHAHGPVMTPTGVPGTYPQIPAEVNEVAASSNAVTLHSIPRKPIGSPPVRNLNQQASPRTIAAANAEAVAQNAHHLHGPRSTSALTVQKPVPFTPTDVGKTLPPLPPKDGPELIKNTAALPSDRPFLGERGKAQLSDVLNSATSGSCGLPLKDKELPCPPTSNGQSQSSNRSYQSPTTRPEELAKALEVPKQTHTYGPRGMNPEYPYVRNSRPRMVMNMEMRREPPRGGRPMPIPRYDNPPSHQFEPIHLLHTTMNGPRTMIRNHQYLPNEIDDIFQVSRSTTSMNTDMFMTTKAPNPEYSTASFPHQVLDVGRPVKPTNMGLRDRIDRPSANSHMNMSMSMNTRSDDLMSLPMSRNRPRAFSRPQTLGRAEGMHSIPRLNQAPGRPYQIPMDPPPPWNLTGIPARNCTADDDVPRGGSTITPLQKPTINRTLNKHSNQSLSQQQIPTGQKSQGSVTQPQGHKQVPTSVTACLTQSPQQLSYNQRCHENLGVNQPVESPPSSPGLTRKCSRCHDGFVKGRQRSIDGVIPISPQRPSQVHLSTLQEHNSEQAHLHHTSRVEAAVPLKSTENQVLNTVDSPTIATEPDHRNHSICCPECCKEQDCHEGCLGHPSPAPSPTRSVRYSVDTTGSGSESQALAKESDTTSSTCERIRIGRLAYIRSAFKKSLKDRPPHTRENSKASLHLKKTSIAELGTPPIDLSTHPLSPGTFWGDSGATGKNGAVEAAKAAIGLKKKGSTSSMDAVAAPSPLRVKKTRRKKKKLSLPDTMRHATAPTTTPADNGTRAPTPNENRRVASGPTLRIPSSASPIGTGLHSASGKSTGRNASGASIATIEVHMPQFGSLGISAVWEMCLVPVEAARMWLRNHPRVMTRAGSVFERGWDMAHIMMLTASRLWTIVFVYSKTGRLKLRKGDTAGTFMMDCCRSALYLLIFMAIGVAVMRVVKWVLDVMAVLGMVINGVVWVVKRLLGYGLFW